MKKASDLLYGRRKKGPGPKPYVEKKLEDFNDFRAYAIAYELFLNSKGIEGFSVQADWEGDALCWVSFSYEDEELQVNDANREMKPERGEWLVDAEWIEQLDDIEYTEGEHTLEGFLELNPHSALLQLTVKQHPFELTKTG